MKTTEMFVDPGIQGTGVCISEVEKLSPEKTAVFKSKQQTGAWIDRATDIVNQFSDFMEANEQGLAKVYIELPTFFSTAKGMTCATGKFGNDSDLVKLSVLIGRFYEVCYEFNIAVEFIRVNDWKGTMPKEVVIKRICRRLKCSEDTFPNHAADAVGISLFVKGVFSANTGG